MAAPDSSDDEEPRSPRSSHASSTWEPPLSLVAEYYMDRNRASLPATALQVTAVTLGVGVLGVPYATRVAGAPLAIALLVGLGAVTDYTARVMAELADVAEASSLSELAGTAARSGGVAFAVAISELVFSGGIAAAELMAFAASLGPVADAALGWNAGGGGGGGGGGDDDGLEDDDSLARAQRRLLVAVGAVLVLAPALWSKRATTLLAPAAVALPALVAMLVSMIVAACQMRWGGYPADDAAGADTLHGAKYFDDDATAAAAAAATGPPPARCLLPSANAVQVIPALVFCFACQHKLLLLHRSMRRSNHDNADGRRRWAYTVRVGVSAATLAYCVTAVVSASSPPIVFDILELYGVPLGGMPNALLVSRAAAALYAVATFPADFHMARRAVKKLVSWALRRGRKREPSPSEVSRAALRASSAAADEEAGGAQTSPLYHAFAEDDLRGSTLSHAAAAAASAEAEAAAAAQPPRMVAHVAVTLVMWAALLSAAALVNPDLASTDMNVANILGGLAAAALFFVTPAASYALMPPGSLSADLSDVAYWGALPNRWRMGAIMLFGAGVVAVRLSTAFTCCAGACEVLSIWRGGCDSYT